MPRRPYAIPTALAPILAAPPALAQALSDLGPNLPQLPPTPWLERTLLEWPWAAVGALALAAFASRILLNRVGKPRAALIAPALCLAAALGVWLTATLVTTEREQVRAEARRLVQATAEADEATLARLLHPDARLDTRYRAPEGARQIIQAVTDTIPDLGIRSASVAEIRAALIEADAVSTQVRVRLESDTVPPYSWWRVEWQREPPGPADAWRVTHIELLWVPGMPNR